MCEQPLSTYLYANECSSNYGCSRWYYVEIQKNAEKITFLHFFCIFLATLTTFSSLVAYLCSEIEKMLMKTYIS